VAAWWWEGWAGSFPAVELAGVGLIMVSKWQFGSFHGWLPTRAPGLVQREPIAPGHFLVHRTGCRVAFGDGVGSGGSGVNSVAEAVECG